MSIAHNGDRVHILYVRDLDGNLFDVPEIEFAADERGLIEAIQTSQRFAHYLADGADAILGAPCAVYEIQQTLEACDVSAVDCAVVVMLCERSKHGDSVQTATMGPVVHTENVAEFAAMAGVLVDQGGLSLAR